MIRVATTRSDLERCTRINNAVHPDSPVTAGQLAASPGVFMLHQSDGYAYVDRSSVPGSAFAMVRVLPDSRRRGIGGELLAAASEHAKTLGAAAMWGRVSESDAASLRFAENRGFEEITRDLEILLDLSSTGGSNADGIVEHGIVELGDEHLRGAYAVVAECQPEAAVPQHSEAPPFEEWVDREGRLSAVAFVALDGDEVVGYARLYELPAVPHRLENGLTAVRRSHRRRGIATALKRAQIAWAVERGYRELITSSVADNAAMRAVNERLGYRPLPALIVVEGPVPVIDVRPVETDADFEAWRQVRIAVLPNERAASVAELRQGLIPGTLMVLALLDGDLAGSGIAGRSDLGGAYVAPRVLPDARRRGVGSTLLAMLAEHAAGQGFAEARALADTPGALAFAERFGFREDGRQVEQVRAISPDEPRPSVPDGIELVALADRPELFRRVYEELALQAFEDMPTAAPIQVSLEDWEREWVSLPEGSFVALAGDEIVGCAGLIRDHDRPDRAENSLTAVRRDARGRGIARALKQTVIAWASANGLRELYTWTQTGNEGMRTVNEKLGYVTRDVSISLHAPLPLP